MLYRRLIACLALTMTLIAGIGFARVTTISSIQIGKASGCGKVRSGCAVDPTKPCRVAANNAPLTLAISGGYLRSQPGDQAGGGTGH